MTLVAKIAHSTFYQTVGKIAAVLLGLWQVSLLTKYLGNTGYGTYATVTAYLGIIIVLAELGLHITNVTKISQPGADERKILSNAFTLRTVSSLIFFAVATVVGYFFLPFEYEIRLGIVFAAAAFALLSVNQVFVGVFQKNFANHMLVFGEIISKSIVVAAIYILVTKGYGVLAILATLNLAFAVHLGVTMYFAYKYIPFSFQFDFSYWRLLLSQSWPIAFSGILNLIYFKTDTVILAGYKGAAAAGIYSVPYKILEVLIAFPALFAGLLLPLLSAAAINNLVRFKAIIQNAFNALIYIAFLVMVEVMIFAEPMIRFITREKFFEFTESVPLFRLLIITTLFLFVGNLFGHAVPALGLQRKMILGYALAAGAGLAVYFTLIPRFSFYGAALGTILTEAIAAFYSMWLVLKTTRHKLEYKGLIKTIVASVITYWLGTIIFIRFGITWWIAAVLVAIIYIIILYKLKGITKDEIKMVLAR
ncbi:MAG: hypothetical protein A3J48_02675 [Candidatus Doudnabacteria bacterium RIFCSPHIGHO2_02_FULL_46_11]|uniref:Uncharacterized protein n=1 Tax=Candidatus Doudnabacteria bacterium RIFCSPHIGHO2_02_FULL_46_11 TaxID=1817832 RepID=A0A1F5P8X9_9BACT|nr:MAG: hypothetical protein A3J48_02675 [Candidatus Doudnabacteria bacterium RIFCSPHIGHO2_02_FULL_46_11]